SREPSSNRRREPRRLLVGGSDSVRRVDTILCIQKDRSRTRQGDATLVAARTSVRDRFPDKHREARRAEVTLVACSSRQRREAGSVVTDQRVRKGPRRGGDGAARKGGDQWPIASLPRGTRRALGELGSKAPASQGRGGRICQVRGRATRFHQWR